MWGCTPGDRRPSPVNFDFFFFVMIFLFFVYGGGEGSKKENGSTQVQKEPQAAEKPQRAKFRGFRNTLKSIRDKLRTDKNLAAAGHSPVQRRHLEQRDLQSFSLKDLTAHSKSLSQAIQDLSSELVTRLQVRDQLRTEQDAMLLEVQDLTSL